MLLVTVVISALITCVLVLRMYFMLLEARRAFSRAFIPRPTALFGSPAKWEAFAHRRPGYREAMPRLHALMEGVFIRALADPSDVDQVAFYLGRICVEDFFEILVLCGNGYGIGAKKLLRGLYERAVTAWYLSQHPEEASNFKAHWRVQQYKNAAALRTLFGDDCIPDDQMAMLKEQSDDVVGRFTYTTKDGKKRVYHAWTKLSVAAMATSFPELYEHHQFMYTDTLAHVHANYGGIEQRLRVGERGITFGDETPPDTDDAVLLAAHAVLLQVLRLQVEHFKLRELEPRLAVCVQDLVAVWGERRQSRGVQVTTPAS